LVANELRVIKGTSGLEYMGANLGSIVLVQPQKVGKEPHLNGKLSYFYGTNGKSHSTNIQLGKYSKSYGWRLNGTLKTSGDKKTPRYFLNNTGQREANLALTVEKEFTQKLKTTIFASTFNTELGVLRGSHIGNLTDLEQAFIRDEPFFTEEDFSYSIESPKQKVNHHLFKSKTSYFITDSRWLEIVLAGQINIRKEFDVRRISNDIPALSLRQYTLFIEGKYHFETSHGWLVNTGVQFNIIDNTNNPETNILPLIPDYISYESGIFTTIQKNINKSLIEFGVRYDNLFQNVITFSRDIRPQIVRFQNTFHNVSSSAGWRYKSSDKLTYSLNIGFGQRSPGINELYSAGLHQGVSGIEEGRPDLNTENALKTTFTVLNNINKKLSIESLLYFQNITNYIYLAPQDELRLTIRGAFPVFKYDQTNAQIYGLDLNLNLEFSKSIKSKIGYSYIKGKDTSNKISLINIPSNVLNANLSYESRNSIKIGNSKFENIAFVFNSKYVFKQNDIDISQDFVGPPEAYFLIDVELSSEIQIASTRLRWILKAENVLNTEYRDYLNRQRYFSDDIGINIISGLSLKF